MHKNTILLSSSRSGTNFFLNVHARNVPDSVVLGEIFRKAGAGFAALEELTGLGREAVLDLVQTDPLALWRHVEAAGAARRQGVIAKIFYYHQPWDAPLWAYFRDNLRVVHLIRSNLFDAWVSYTLMTRTGQARLTRRKAREERETDQAPATDNLTFTADPEEAAQFIAERREHIARARGFFAGADFTELLYEDISATPGACYAAICRLHGLTPDPERMRPATLQRQKRRSNAQIVENYEAVAHLDRRYF